MGTTILCPTGHRHGLPIVSSECWVSAEEPRTISVTLREFDVATELLRDGADNQTIAGRLFISEDTVKSHMKRLLQRTGARTRTELVVAVFRGRVRLVAVEVAASVFWAASQAPLVH